MTITADSASMFEKFINNWENDDRNTKDAFLRLKSYMETKNGVMLRFNPRAGITNSLHAIHENGKRPLFAMIDVIEDEPKWLSICFYKDAITDPGEIGNPIPESLLEEDGYCFDVEIFDDVELSYIEERMDEAYNEASA